MGLFVAAISGAVFVPRLIEKGTDEKNSGTPAAEKEEAVAQASFVATRQAAFIAALPDSVDLLTNRMWGWGEGADAEGDAISWFASSKGDTLTFEVNVLLDAVATQEIRSLGEDWKISQDPSNQQASRIIRLNWRRDYCVDEQDGPCQYERGLYESVRTLRSLQTFTDFSVKRRFG